MAPSPASEKRKGPMLVAVLYFFSGKSRKSSLKTCLEGMSDSERTFVVTEVDIVHGQGHDLSLPDVREAWLEKIRKGFFDVVLITPPFSRVRMANLRGPPPIRSMEYPWGFPWLSAHHSREANLGNVLVVFMAEAYEAAEQCMKLNHLRFVFLFSEHPEDLGRVYREEDGWEMDPAAIWQLDRIRNLLKMTGLMLFTVAFHQCCFGAMYRKPTRIISNIPALKAWGEEGWPRFDENRAYWGPALECKCRTGWTLARKSNAEAFRTTATSAYPPKMDKSLAEAIRRAVSEPDPSKVGRKEPAPKPAPAEAREDFERGREEPCLKQARASSWEGGIGTFSGTSWEGERRTFSGEQAEREASSGDEAGWKEWNQRPMLAYYKGKHRVIHDGGGLCSPGRWPVKNRAQVKEGKGMALVAACRKQFLKWILKQEGRAEDTFGSLIRGELKESPFEGCLAEAREEVDKELEAWGKEPRRKEGDRDSEVNFRRLKAMAEVLEDEDSSYLEEMAAKRGPSGG